MIKERIKYRSTGWAILEIIALRVLLHQVINQLVADLLLRPPVCLLEKGVSQ